MTGLTSDTLHLSRPKNGLGSGLDKVSAIDCTNDLAEVGRISQRVAELVRDSLSENSRRAYASDLARFEHWGGTIPASSHMIAEYLADHEYSHSAASLVRWMTSLAKAHRARGERDPTQSELVRSVMRGIRRHIISMPQQAKPLVRDDLLLALDRIGDGVKADRDRALLLIGFAGGFRRSELVALDLVDIEPVKQGIVVTIRRSKTDQLGLGRKIGIPNGRSRYCPVATFERWLSTSGIGEGPIFRPVTRHGRICPHRLSGVSVVRTFGTFGGLILWRIGLVWLVDFRRRSCGVASADIRWSFV